MNSSRQLAQSAVQAGSSPWACRFCQNAHQQTRRLDTSVFRRKLSGTTARRAQPQEHPNNPNALTMKKVHEHYKRKNRTVMYGLPCGPIVDLRWRDVNWVDDVMA